MSYRGIQDRGALELAALGAGRHDRSADLYRQAEAFIARRWPEWRECPDAFMAVLLCREEQRPASDVPWVRDQLMAYYDRGTV